ncbi:acetoacetate decarboxylase family protein [Rufibacter ruber]|uniref:acetoacetate decarboxylase family protein n=1 Tax=Rufibacter ruber TaxID=1783499 RepID=UPI00128FCE3A|nr:acetoacetate decarboxylase family protein [Rufibacter ruber]
MAPAGIVPAPWFLTGHGAVFLYAFPKAFLRQFGFLDPDLCRQHKLGLGAVMAVKYDTSGVGPYQELLFIPGIFRRGGKLTFAISKIYVSTHASAASGRENWGIPKEVADFHFRKQGDGTQLFDVSREGRTFFSAEVHPKGFSFPVTTKLLPLFRVVQERRGRLLLTQPQASGHAHLANVPYLEADAAYFPPVQHLKPLAVLAVQDFKMVFPVAEVLR